MATAKNTTLLPPPVLSPFLTKLIVYRKAAQPLIFCQTHEELRLQAELKAFVFSSHPDAIKNAARMFVWDELRGLREFETIEKFLPIKDTAKPGEFMDYIRTFSETKLTDKDKPHLILVNSLHHYMGMPRLQRCLLNAHRHLKDHGHTLLFVSPKMDIPLELTTHFALLDYPLPKQVALRDRLQFVKECHDQGNPDKAVALEPEVLSNAVEAALGLTSEQAEDAFTVASLSTGGFSTEFIKGVFGEKVQLVKKTGFLQYLPPDESFDDLGGMGDLKKWLRLQSGTFSDRAKDYGLPPSKGCLLNGPPGVGKTAVAKAVSRLFLMPCFQLDVGTLFGSRVGESEANLRMVLAILESLGKCILFLDEVEKSLNRSAVSGAGDSGLG